MIHKKKKKLPAVFKCITYRRMKFSTDIANQFELKNLEGQLIDWLVLSGKLLRDLPLEISVWHSSCSTNSGSRRTRPPHIFLSIKNSCIHGVQPEFRSNPYVHFTHSSN